MAKRKRPRRITLREARAAFSYDKASGILRWRISRGRMAAGQRAGTVSSTGKRWRLEYRNRNVFYRGRIYKEHNLIWLIVTGAWPARQIDHRDNDATNNRWTNLRLATSAQQKSNARLSPRNRSGFKWVRTFRSKYQAQVHGVYLGTFTSPRVAHERAAAFARKRDGQFFNPGRTGRATGARI